MGRSYVFECSKCGYRAKVSGGSDRGFNFQVQTILCTDCKALHDAVVRLRMANSLKLKWATLFRGVFANSRAPAAPPTFESALNGLPYAGRHFVWVPFPIRCPVEANHSVRSWNDPDRCPKCGVYLDKNAVPYRIWE